VYHRPPHQPPYKSKYGFFSPHFSATTGDYDCTTAVSHLVEFSQLQKMAKQVEEAFLSEGEGGE
jgi:hypothetical protein